MTPTEYVDSLSGRDYMAQVARLGCYLCRLAGHDDSPAQVHHPRKHGGRRDVLHKETVPLCFEHHQGATGVHMLRKRVEAVYGVTEEQMSEQTRLDVIALISRNVRYATY